MWLAVHLLLGPSVVVQRPPELVPWQVLDRQQGPALRGLRLVQVSRVRLRLLAPPQVLLLPSPGLDRQSTPSS